MNPMKMSLRHGVQLKDFPAQNQIRLLLALGVKSPKKITLRYREDVTQDMRILHRTGTDDAGEPIYRTFDVMDFNDIENKKKQLEVTCNEVGVNG